ncbi:C2 domain protein [Diplocarpon rosae]|nr:C2 domain protein [Diplocarpon rosae]
MADDQHNTGATGGTIPASILLGNEELPEIGLEPLINTKIPTGGLYSTWEGVQPKEGSIARKPLPVQKDPQFDSTDQTNLTSSSTTNSNVHTPTSSDGSAPTPAINQSDPIVSENTPSLLSPNQASELDREDLPPVSSRSPPIEPIQFGQAYSARNPLPTVEGFHESEKKRQEESKKYFAEGANNGERLKEKDTKGPKTLTKDEARAGATEDVPIGAEKSNVLFQPTPDVDLSIAFKTIRKDALTVAYVTSGTIVVLDWLFIGGGFRELLKSLFPATGIAAAIYFILINVGESTGSRKIEEAEPKVEKLRYVPESVEWINSLVETLWHTLQQELFDGIATQIDDTIKPFIPKGVPATVKIAKLGHGVVPVRVLSMRSLPDSEFGELVPQHGDRKDATPAENAARDKAIENEQGGVFYNLEISFAYHEAPLRPRTDAMHVDILTMIGPVPIPIFVQVKEFVATIRVRLQMHPDLPFLKNMTFALTENPKVNASVSLGAPWVFDLLNLPLIDSTLVSQINGAAAQFVQPKSMSLDMTVYVGGSDQKLETDAIGVLFVKIHRARSLARQDSRGPGADPYLTIAFSKYEKPMYATRIIKGDRNPVWEETAIIMIKAEHVKRNENVLLRLWDSDTTGSDDVSGICEFPLQELVVKANEMQKREDQLQGDVEGTDAEGVLEWEIGYFPRAEFHRALRTDATDPRDRHGNKVAVVEEEKTQNAQNTVPDPNLPSGILGLTIHQCINVEVKNPNKKSMGHVEVQRQDDDGEDDGEAESVSIDYIPSLYVSADINDQLVYRTRVKNITNTPTYNSSTETYIRDWRLATLNLSVWDTRKKKNDCLVGVASVKLSDIFQESSSVVKFYDLKGGDGTGRIRVSLIFRSMKMKLEESLLGYSVGSFVFSSPIVATGDMNTSKLNIRASGSRRAIKGSGSKSEGSYTWTLEKPKNVIPVSYRYLSPVVLEFVGAGLTEKLKGPLGKNKQYAVLWLNRLVDNKSSTFTLPIWRTNNADRLIQNVVSESDPTMQLERVGEVTFTAKFKAGIDEAHEEFIEGHNQWCTFQAWKAARKSGQRDDQANRETSETVDELAKGITKSMSIKV